ncbi:uncharacterized protein LOC107267434 isoform X8 [Cephus cinctus]|uniref:Uncharacterized protein LOC107267434 isoform X8 n=1 Tax=Cephus cinctus TaxID=211228 RepID=A0AAJ7BUH8_CEPCN|nr:uncharacterized protein LOC107267434 isoform X8 [Cephus cinctus]
MSRVGLLLARSALLIAALLSSTYVEASEFPERECCDPIYPLPEPTSKAPSAPTPTGRSGTNIKTGEAILNCLFAQQVCLEDSSCSAILQIVPRVCGGETVACSTITINKCQAALRTLQAFSFFRPTCLCREPHVDPQCNNFRDYVFDHPCIYALKNDEDSYAIDALPNCNHALSVCQRNKSCTKLFEEFKANCKSRDNKCRMENRDACHDAWTQLRHSPMFGCICPNNHMKKRCDRIFSMVNQNPCIVKVIAHPDNSTSFEVIESQLENPLIDADHQDLRDLKQVPSEGIYHHQFHHRRNQSSDDGIHPGSSAVASSPVSEGEKSLPPPPVKLILSSTCHHAYTSCKNDPDCRTELQPVLNHCELASCARNECMDALQQFYKMASHKHSMEIAFCLCKKSDGKRDECIVAQEKMHPTCAQRIEGAEMPACHSVAEACKEDKACKTKLVYFERSCAVDSVTKKCAGPPLECRKAMIGILGTELRLSCACKSADLTQIYDCLGWQRLLWVNPCVVDAQRDFHARRKHHHHPRTTTTSVTTSKVLSTSSAAGGVVPVNDVLEDNQIPEHAGRPQTEPTESSWQVLGMTTSTATATSATGATGTTGTRSTATTKAASPTTTTLLASTTTTLATTSTTISTTPRTTTTSTAPPRFCVVQRPSQSHQYIREGKGKRLYREDEPECSELCQCSEGEVLICNTICVDSSPCKTDFAFYNHAAPAYQAYRGRCLCYSGRFICMRPSPDAYSIPHGIFMFLGYSETDENLLRPHNNLTVLDAVSSLDTFMRQEVNNQTVCTLFLYNVTRENVIAVARLGTDNPALNGSQTQSLQHLLRIKEECASMLQELSEKINNRHQEVHTHPLLSIFKMAEVEIKLPYSSEATTIRSSCCLLAVALLAVLFTISRAPRSSSSSSTSSSSGRVDS